MPKKLFLTEYNKKGMDVNNIFYVSVDNCL